MDINKAANAQLGAVNQIAPVTTRTITLGNGQSMTFRRIPAGKFIMGSATGHNDEYPRTIVEIKKPFWISEMEVRVFSMPIKLHMCAVCGKFKKL